MPQKRKPKRVPGPAISGPSRRVDDFTLPASLYKDAFVFYESARLSGRRRDIGSKERFLRAALFASFSFFEAFINGAAAAHAKAHGEKIDPPVRDVLEEMETTVNEKGYITRRPRFYSLELRFSVLALFLAGKEFPRGTQLWRDFIAVKRLRDKWTHPKPPFNPRTLRLKDVQVSLVTLRAMIVELHEMLGIRPPLWLAPWDVLIAYMRGDKEPHERWIQTEIAHPDSWKGLEKAVRFAKRGTGKHSRSRRA